MTKINKEGWDIKKLGEVCVTSSGGTPSKSHPEYFEGGTIPWLRSGEVSQGNIYETELCITEEGMNNSSAKMFPQNTVVVAMYGATVGEVGILRNPMTTNQAVCGIFPTEFHLPEFLYYVLAHKKNDFIKQAAGGAQPNISQAVVRNTNIPLPPLPIQQRIVEELDETNSIISAKKQQLSKLDELAQSIFYNMFGDPVANEKGWEVKTLGEICDVRDGTHDSPQYLTHSECVLITSKNVVNGVLSFEGANFISDEDFEAINKRSKVDEGDIIMPMIGTIGNPIIVPHTTQRFAVKNVSIIKFIENSSILNIYLHSLLISKSYKDYIMSHNKGGTQKFIALGTIRKLNIPLPPLPLQETFAARVAAIEEEKAAIDASIEKMQTLLDARMQEYFG